VSTLKSLRIKPGPQAMHEPSAQDQAASGDPTLPLNPGHPHYRPTLPPGVAVREISYAK